MLFLTSRITERSKGWFLIETVPGRAESIAVRRSFDRATAWEESHGGSASPSASGTKRAGHYFSGFYGREPGKPNKKPFKVLWDRDIDTPTGPTDTVLEWVRSNIGTVFQHTRSSCQPLPVTKDMHWFALHTVVVGVGASEGYRFMLLEHVI